MENNQSKGIKIFGILLITWGTATFLLAVLNYLVCGAYSGYNKFPSSLPWELLYGVIFISGGIGLKKQKSWARKLTIFVIVPLFVIIIPYSQFTYLTHFKGYVNPKLSLAPVFEMIRIAFGVSLLYFFTRPKVKEQFK